MTYRHHCEQRSLIAVAEQNVRNMCRECSVRSFNIESKAKSKKQKAKLLCVFFVDHFATKKDASKCSIKRGDGMVITKVMREPFARDFSRNYLSPQKETDETRRDERRGEERKERRQTNIQRERHTHANKHTHTEMLKCFQSLDRERSSEYRELRESGGYR